MNVLSVGRPSGVVQLSLDIRDFMLGSNQKYDQKAGGDLTGITGGLKTSGDLGRLWSVAQSQMQKRL